MHVEDGLEVVHLDLGERLVAQNPGIVNQDVDPAERLERGVHDVLRAIRGRHAVVVRGGVAAGCLDLGHHLVGGGAVSAAPVGGTAEIVHDDLCSLPGQQQRVLPPQSRSGAGHHRHAPIQSQCHVNLSQYVR